MNNPILGISANLRLLAQAQGDFAGAIKLRLAIVVSVLAVAPLTEAKQGDFAKTLTPEELRTAGLSKLNSEELTNLERLIARYQSDRPPTSEKTSPAAKASVGKATGTLPDWVEALIVLEHVGSKAEKPGAIESRLNGLFTGWTGNTVFVLENGQRWAPTNRDHYTYSPGIKSPKIAITPSSLGTYWMKVEGVNRPCRVRPVKLD